MAKEYMPVLFCTCVCSEPKSQLSGSKIYQAALNKNAPTNICYFKMAVKTR